MTAPLHVRLVRKQFEAKSICSFDLEEASGAALPPFQAGAHIDVHLPGNTRRQYSIVNDPDDCRQYRIAVLLDPNGRGGSLLMHQLEVGQVLSISPPRNLFPLDAGAIRHVLFAGGIGITPLLCMATVLARMGADFELHYSCRSRPAAAFLAHLEQASFRRHCHVYFDDEASFVRVDRVLEQWDEGTHAYACGPTGFMEHVLSTAHELGLAQTQLHREYFNASKPSSEANLPFMLQLARSNREFEVFATETALEALRRHGMELPHSCEQGFCGTCLTPVVAGLPDHRDSFLTRAEREANDCFTPCCSRSKTSRLVVDL